MRNEQTSTDVYYYYLAAWSEGAKDPIMEDNNFVKFNSIKDLANEYYEGNVEDALADDVSVFTQDEYEEWMNETRLRWNDK